MSITITVEAAGLDEMLARIPDGPRREATLHEILDRGRFIVQREIMDLLPVKTGNSRRNTDTDIQGLTAHVTVRGGAAFADQGTQPHEIFPRAANFLRFVPGGGANPAARLTGVARRGREDVYIFALEVHHPGQPAENFMATGLNESLDDFERLMERSLGDMIGGE